MLMIGARILRTSHFISFNIVPLFCNIHDIFQTNIFIDFIVQLDEMIIQFIDILRSACI